MGNINLANLTDYQYKLYSDYLDQLDDILIRRGQQTGLSIEYWHIRVDLSKNFDEELRMQNSYKHFVYDLYHFLPTINASPLVYQIAYNPQQQGTTNLATGNFSIYLLEQPLPGDIFRFYPYNETTERTELFRVTNVRYMRTSKNKLKLYEIEFETAPFLVDTLEHVRINEIYCWDTENFKFLNEFECNQASEIIEERDKLIDQINEWYDPINGWYGKCPNFETNEINCQQSTTRPLVFLNTILKRLKKAFPALDIKPIFGIGTAKINIYWGLPKKPVTDPNDPQAPVEWVYSDYWDTFTCLSFTPEANSGEIFNVTKILAGECESCPEELVQEITCHKELVELVQQLLSKMYPLIPEDILYDKTCDRRCCDAYDPNYVISCLRDGNIVNKEFDELYWDHEGAGAGKNTVSFCEKYENGLCIPLYISWQDGAVWPQGGFSL